MFNDVFRVCSQGVLLLSGVCGLEPVCGFTSFVFASVRGDRYGCAVWICGKRVSLDMCVGTFAWSCPLLLWVLYVPLFLSCAMLSLLMSYHAALGLLISHFSVSLGAGTPYESALTCLRHTFGSWVRLVSSLPGQNWLECEQGPARS